MARHDGLYVDYSRFSDITKDMLKNANVVRNKSIKSPQKLQSQASRTRNIPRTNIFSQGNSPSLESSQLGASFTQQSVSARLSSSHGPANMIQGGGVLRSQNVVIRKTMPQYAQMIIASSDLTSGPASS